MRMPKRVPRAYPSRMASTAETRLARVAGAGEASARNSCTTTTNHSDASTALYSGASPRSGKRFGSMPSDTLPDHAVRIACATARRPRASVRPRIAMNVSRPQSVNHGYPAMIVLPAAAAHEILLRGAGERRERQAPLDLGRAQPPGERYRIGVDIPAGAQHHDGFATGEIEHEGARRS